MYDKNIWRIGIIIYIFATPNGGYPKAERLMDGMDR
jgi:hypothetical protein